MKVRKAVIPAAGLGTRMLPATKTVPKEMLPMVDKPVIQYIIEEAVAAGIEDILIVTNRAKSAMDDYFDYYPELETRLLQSGKESELVEVRRAADLANIFYVRQKETKGLGHAIGRARRFVGDEPFAVLLGDDIMRAKKPVTLQLVEAAEKYGASALGVQEVATEAISRYSSVKVSPLEERIFDVSDMNEKPTPEQRLSNYAILGRYVLTPEIFDILENVKPGYGGEIQLTDGLRELCRRSRMVAVDFEGRLDLEPGDARALDWVVASIHHLPLEGLQNPDVEKCTHLWSQVAKDPRVHVIGHSGDPQFAYDVDKVIPLFGEHHKLVEINNHSFQVRPDNIPNCRKIALACKRYGVPIVVDSDAHFETEVGCFDKALAMLREIDFPQELILNASEQRLNDYLARYTSTFEARS